MAGVGSSDAAAAAAPAKVLVTKRAKGLAEDFLEQLGGGDGAADSNDRSSETSSSAAGMSPMMGRGRGRGVELNKPAWMTTGDLGTKPPVVSAADEASEASNTTPVLLLPLLLPVLLMTMTMAMMITMMMMMMMMIQKKK